MGRSNVNSPIVSWIHPSDEYLVDALIYKSSSFDTTELVKCSSNEAIDRILRKQGNRPLHSSIPGAACGEFTGLRSST